MSEKESDKPDGQQKQKKNHIHFLQMLFKLPFITAILSYGYICSGLYAYGFWFRFPVDITNFISITDILKNYLSYGVVVIGTVMVLAWSFFSIAAQVNMKVSTEFSPLSFKSTKLANWLTKHWIREPRRFYVWPRRITTAALIVLLILVLLYHSNYCTARHWLYFCILSFFCYVVMVWFSSKRSAVNWLFIGSLISIFFALWVRIEHFRTALALCGLFFFLIVAGFSLSIFYNFDKTTLFAVSFAILFCFAFMFVSGYMGRENASEIISNERYQLVDRVYWTELKDTPVIYRRSKLINFVGDKIVLGDVDDSTHLNYLLISQSSIKGIKFKDIDNKGTQKVSNRKKCSCSW